MRLECLGVFGNISLPHENRSKRVELVQLMQSSCHQIASEFFSMNGPDPPHWTIKSCFGAFHSVWVHLAMFHYYTKLGAKRVELEQLMQMFVS